MLDAEHILSITYASFDNWTEGCQALITSFRTMDPLRATAFINSAQRLATFFDSARAVAQDHGTRETVVVMVCLLTALILTDFLISLLKFVRAILWLCLFEGGRRMLLSWRQRQGRMMRARQTQVTDGNSMISRLADGQETEHTLVGREYTGSGGGT